MKSLRLWLLLSAEASLCIAAVAATFDVPPPAFLSATSTSGGMKISYRGATNFQFLIQSSSNLINWSLLASNVATNQVITFVDAQATNQPARFYKALSLTTPFFYQGTFSSVEQGAFILFARTNRTATFLGVNTLRRRGEYLNALMVGTDNVGCGNFILNEPGCLLLTSSNTLSGAFTNAQHQTGTITGVQKANTGIFNGAAGFYTGTVSSPHSGNAQLLLCPDGSFALYRTDSYTGKNDGTVSSMNSSGIVDAYFNGSTLVHVLGSFDRSSRTFGLTIHEADELPSLLMMTLSQPLF